MRHVIGAAILALATSANAGVELCWKDGVKRTGVTVGWDTATLREDGARLASQYLCGYNLRWTSWKANGTGRSTGTVWMILPTATCYAFPNASAKKRYEFQIQTVALFDPNTRDCENVGEWSQPVRWGAWM